MTESNAWFEKMATIPAGWDRMIFCTGAVRHGGKLADTALLTDEPCTGRLALKGFFTCPLRVSA